MVCSEASLLATGSHFEDTYPADNLIHGPGWLAHPELTSRARGIPPHPACLRSTGAPAKTDGHAYALALGSVLVRNVLAVPPSCALIPARMGWRRRSRNRARGSRLELFGGEAAWANAT